MLTLQAATTQLENLDFEESYLIGIEIEKRKAGWLGRTYLESIRKKRRVIYDNTIVKGRGDYV